MTAFAAAARALFRDRNLTVAALWRSGGDPLTVGVAVRIILSAPDVVAEFGGARLASASVMIDVPLSDAAVVAKGDTFQVDDVTYEVTAAPLRDVERLSWHCEARVA